MATRRMHMDHRQFAGVITNKTVFIIVNQDLYVTTTSVCTHSLYANDEDLTVFGFEGGLDKNFSFPSQS